nr:beta-1,3-glucan-binding protein-like [Leptinotarsa decemlineata]
MINMFSFTWLCVLVSLVNISYGQYEIPPVTLEAYRPRGFRASIKADNLTELFAFHGKLNEKINQIEPGEFGEDVRSPVDGYFTYYNPNMELKINDEVHYWVFVQHKKLGYRRDAQVWKVTELRNSPGTECEPSVTVISDRTKVCRNMTIFEDQFGGSSIDISKWIIEQYVPGPPDYEFVVYRPYENVTLVNDGNLVVIPHLASDKDIEADPLDLTDG